MRKVSCALIVFALVLTPLMSSAVVVELIQNGGFENWTAGTPNAWDITRRNNAGDVRSEQGMTIAEETSELRPGTTGTKSLKITVDVADWAYYHVLTSNTFEPVKAGTTASYSSWAKTPKLNDSDTGTTRFRAYVYSSTDGGATWVMDTGWGAQSITGTAWNNVTTTYAGLDNVAKKFRIGFFAIDARDYYFDDVSLIGDDGAPPPIGINSTNPQNTYMLSRTVTLAAVPEGGTGSYKQVQFDIGNNGTIDGTDTTEPFEYVWNTQTSMPGNGNVPVKFIVTDSSDAIGNTVINFMVDNRFDGRQELMTNANFDQWQEVVGSNQLPVDWVENQTIASGSYGQAQDSSDGLTTPCLQTVFDTFDPVNRYTLRYVGKQNVGGVYENHQVTYWGRGASSALRYFVSTDGVTWTDADYTAASAPMANWSYAIGQVRPLLSPNLYEWQTITTVNMQGTAKYDRISWKATFIPFIAPAGVTGSWDIYE